MGDIQSVVSGNIEMVDYTSEKRRNIHISYKLGARKMDLFGKSSFWRTVLW